MKKKNNFIRLLNSFDKSFALPPKKINLIINNVCNSKCIMCDVGIKENSSPHYKNIIQDGKNNLSLKTLNKLIQEIKWFNPSVNICATEPLLHPQIIEIIKLIKKNKLNLTLTTNGILLERYAKEIVSLGVDVLSVSLDGLKKTHDKIRGVKKFEEVIRGIKLVRKLRNESGKKVPMIRARYTISNFNYKELSKFTDYAFNNLGVDKINFGHLYFVTESASKEFNKHFSFLGNSSSRNIKCMNPKKIDINLLWKQIEDINKKYENRINFHPKISTRQDMLDYYNSDILPSIKKNKCPTPWNMAVLQPNGDMIIRSMCIQYKVGNIDKQYFKSIWNGKRYRFFRRKLIKHKLFPICHRCCAVKYS
ncbi:radical SAM protein [Candidatus Pacearchaeota archaeon]|nr:radical SAM protein [Candidatus Pacearchaeota archaeon]